MSTATQHRRAFTGLSITEVTSITGLDRAEIYRARELEQLGIPGDFSYPKGEEVYTPRGIAALVEALPKLGQDAAAKLLRVALEQAREPKPAPVGGFGWLKRWQDQHEGGGV